MCSIHTGSTIADIDFQMLLVGAGASGLSGTSGRTPRAHGKAMDRSRVISILRRHEAELRALGIEHLSVFGSTATDTATEGSDVDIAVRLAPGPRGFSRLGRLEAVQLRLSELLGCTVDVVEEPARSSRVQRAIEQDGIRAF